MKNSRKILGIILLIAALICIGGAAAYIGLNKSRENVYERVREEVRVVEEQPEETYVSPIDFAALQELNPDIYAWIEIPDTNINYPIVQSAEDDDYYLNHTIEGEEGYPGSIYTQLLNSKDFTDYNTVVYGHNMKDGSMFKGLHDYEDITYLQEHSQVNIYTPEEKLTYQIFAAVEYSDVHILKNYDFNDPEQRQAFLDSVYACRNMKDSIDETVEVTADDKLLTLSTCIGGKSDKRFIVEAVLLDE